MKDFGMPSETRSLGGGRMYIGVRLIPGFGVPADTPRTCTESCKDTEKRNPTVRQDGARGRISVAKVRAHSFSLFFQLTWRTGAWLEVMG